MVLNTFRQLPKLTEGTSNLYSKEPPCTFAELPDILTLQTTNIPKKGQDKMILRPTSGFTQVQKTMQVPLGFLSFFFCWGLVDLFTSLQ